MNTKKCPNCGELYSDYPAISRKDNKMEICPDCGMSEAIGAFFNAMVWRIK